MTVEIPNVTSTCEKCNWSNAVLISSNADAEQQIRAAEELDEQHHEERPDCDGQVIPTVEL